MIMPPWLVVLLKELRDAARDRRAVMALFLFPVIGPLIVYFMLNAVIDIGEDVQEIMLPVLGVEYAPDLIDSLQQAGVSIERVSAFEGENLSAVATIGISELIENRTYDFVLVVPEDFSTKVAASETVNVELHHDSSRTTVGPKVLRVQNLIDNWSRETASLRLFVRGVNPSVIRPVLVSRIDIASSQARAQQILAMIPLFVIMAAFMSGVGVAVDATAGERERKSLEPLLVNPVARSSLVIGKWLAAVIFSVLGLILVMALNLFALSRVPLEQMGFSFTLGPLEIAGMLLATVPLAFFAAGLQIFIGIFAKSFKDAQAYISLLSILPMAPYFYTVFNNTGRELWMSFVPLLGQTMLLNDVVSGRTPAMLDFGMAAFTLLVGGLVLVMLGSRLLKRERIIFS